MIIARRCEFGLFQLSNAHKLIDQQATTFWKQSYQCNRVSTVLSHLKSVEACASSSNRQQLANNWQQVTTIGLPLVTKPACCNRDGLHRTCIHSQTHAHHEQSRNTPAVPSQKVKQRSTQGVTLLTRDTLLPLLSTMGSPCFTLTSSTYVPLLLWSSSMACGAVEESVGAASLMTQCRRLTRVSDTSTKLILGR